MPQPDDVEFEQPAQEKLIEDEAKLAQAKADPDIHCYYCGTRNPGTAETCSQCGALLAEGTARASGQVLGTHRDKAVPPVTCPACGAANAPDAPRCVQCGASLAQPKPEPGAPKVQAAPKTKPRAKFLGGAIGIGFLLLAIAACATFFILLNRTEDLTGQVQAIEWSRSVTVEALVPVSYEGWRDEIPAGALIGVCTEQVHHRESRSTGQTREICGTPYTVDKGSGYGEVVQDCTTEEIKEEVPVYAESCEYTVEEWQQIDQATQRGNDLNPRWPAPQLRAGQREGKREESYDITFKTEQGTYTYNTSNAALFAQAQPGSRWILQINTFNTVTDIEPVQ
jgi:ribosomal protein L40E